MIHANQPNACSSEEIKQSVSTQFTGKMIESSVEELFPESGICEIKGDRAVLCTGSLYLIGEVVQQLYQNENLSYEKEFGSNLQDLR